MLLLLEKCTFWKSLSTNTNSRPSVYGRHANVWNINTRFNSRNGNMRKKESSHFHNLKPLLWRRSAVHWFPLVAYQPRSLGQGSSAYTHCRGSLDTYPKIWSFYHPLKYKYSVCLLLSTHRYTFHHHCCKPLPTFYLSCSIILLYSVLLYFIKYNMIYYISLYSV